jgi:4'-phosphopantetheinyl transferase
VQQENLTEPSFINRDQFPLELESSVHVWKFPVTETEFTLLTPAEKELAARFRFDGDRNRFSVGRQALRLLLSRYLCLPPTEIVIAGEKNQKPFIDHPSSDIHFNISHSGNWVLIAFAKDELGIDIEKMNTRFSYDGLLEDHFSAAEKTYISRSADPVAAFYFLWTRKEALTKARGTGLQENLKEIVVLDLNGLFEIGNQSWKLKSFNISLEYPAAIAFSGSVDNIVYFDGNRIC